MIANLVIAETYFALLIVAFALPAIPATLTFCVSVASKLSDITTRFCIVPPFEEPETPAKLPVVLSFVASVRVILPPIKTVSILFVLTPATPPIL